MMIIMILVVVVIILRKLQIAGIKHNTISFDVDFII